MSKELAKQTDQPPFPACFHDACYFMSLLWQIEREYNLGIFTWEGILKVYNQELNVTIDPDMTIKDPQGLCDHVAGKGKMLFKGKFDPDYDTLPNEVEILCYHKDGASFNHFVAGNGYSVCAYDPWADGSSSVKDGKLIGKRIYQIVSL